MRINYCEHTKKRLETSFIISPDAHNIGELALRSMLLELSATPKPGLVDRFNSGAHKDMNYNLFLFSTSSIAIYFIYIAQIGLEHNSSQPLNKLLPKIRQIGLFAEEKMFQLTNGVNTQKGIIFLLALTSAAAGYLIKIKEKISAINLSNVIKEICKDIVKNELAILHQKSDMKLTSGEKIYLQYNLTGIRGEAEKGFPVVIQYGLPALQEALNSGIGLNIACLHSLCNIMSRLNDTALLHRHNIEVLREVKRQMRKLIDNGGLLNDTGQEEWQILEKKYNEQGINPGGSADMLAVSLMFHFLATKNTKKHKGR